MKSVEKQALQQSLITIVEQLLIESGEAHHREVKLNASFQRYLGIDSLGKAELFQRISKELQVHLPDSLLAQADCLDDIVNYIDTHANDLVPVLPQPKERAVHGKRQQLDVSQAQSLMDILFLYAEKMPDLAHLYFQHEQGHEEVVTYKQLLTHSLRMAQGLCDQGLKPGDTIAIMLPSHPNFFYTFFGVLLAGGIPVPIYPPFRMHMLEAYAKTEAHILKSAEVRMLITFDKAETLSYLLQGFVPSLKVVATVDQVMSQQTLQRPFKAKETDFAFIQYTSGSTSNPKGVLLTHANLLANIHAYGKAIQLRSEDVAVSWLPLYHDMGLIGAWLGSLYHGIPLVLLTPFTFLNHPERWLWAIHYHRGTVAAAPNFAYELCLRKIEPAQIEGLDLSSWRLAANGAEKVYPSTLKAFSEKFATYGLKDTTITPVYGLAETAVGLAIPPLNRVFKVDEIDRKQFEENRIAEISQGDNTLSFVACGKALPGHAMRIVDDHNQVLPERRVGNLQFSGPSTMQGYYNNPEATQAVFHDEWVDTGDLAYLADDELYITGRRKDLIIKAGRNLYPAEIEELVGSVTGIRQGCVAAFGITDAKRATEQLVIVAETKEKNKQALEKIRDAINEQVSTVLDIVPDHIELVAPRTVPKTSSGKLQRAACKQLYLDNKLTKFHMPAWLQVTKLLALWARNKAWQSAKLAAKFVYTAYVAILLMLTLLPVWLWVYFSSDDKAARITKAWARFLLWMSACWVTVKGKEYLAPKQAVVYAANHASYLDAIVLTAVLPFHTRFVGKKELFSTPIIRTFMQKLGHISVDRLDLAKGLEDAKQLENQLKAGHAILIFPEGTFGYAAGLRPFRLGAFKAAVETNTAICPIALSGTRSILRNDEKLMQPGKVTVTVSPLILPQGQEWADVMALRNSVRAAIAAHCGEPSLDFIAAQTVAPKL